MHMNSVMELIPGLPNHVALECLIRIPFDNFSKAVCVSKAWQVEIELPEFRQHRKAASLSRSVLIMSQARVDPTRKRGALKFSTLPVYRLTVCEVETGTWSELPPAPGFPDGLPMFCRLVGVGSDLVVMGGSDPLTWEVTNSVFIYNFISATWRRGADMPGGRRSFFACASDFDRTVFVAGGHDDEKNALRSAMAYDVAKDEWVPLPDMAKERDECKGIFQGGKFHVIGGYCTEMQGRFERSAETFDVATRKWGPIQEDYLEAATCPRTYVEGPDGKLYMFREGNIKQKDGATWKDIGGLPAGVRNVAYVAAWHDKLLVIGCAEFEEPHVAYLMDLEDHTWTKVESPEDYIGHVQSGCWLEV